MGPFGSWFVRLGPDLVDTIGASDLELVGQIGLVRLDPGGLLARV